MSLLTAKSRKSNVVVMLRSAHSTPAVDAESLLFIAWAISPYGCVQIAWPLVEKFTRVPYRSLISPRS